MFVLVIMAKGRILFLRVAFLSLPSGTQTSFPLLEESHWISRAWIAASLSHRLDHLSQVYSFFISLRPYSFFYMMPLMTIDHISSFKGPSGNAGPFHPSQFARREDIPVQPSSERFSSPARPVPMTGILYFFFSIFFLVIIS
jgi:hypothetical protein